MGYAHLLREFLFGINHVLENTTLPCLVMHIDSHGYHLLFSTYNESIVDPVLSI